MEGFTLCRHYSYVTNSFYHTHTRLTLRPLHFISHVSKQIKLEKLPLSLTHVKYTYFSMPNNSSQACLPVIKVKQKIISQKMICSSTSHTCSDIPDIPEFRHPRGRGKIMLEYYAPGDSMASS